MAAEHEAETSSSGGSAGGPRISRGRSWRVVLVIMLIEAVAALLDFWGVSGPTSKLSSQITLATAEPLYSWRWEWGVVSRDRISMILVDDETIRLRGLRYPLPYDVQAELLWNIVSRYDEERALDPPAAILIDLIYADERPPVRAGDLTFADFRAMLGEIAAEATLTGLPRPGDQLRRQWPPLEESRPGLMVVDSATDHRRVAASLATQGAPARPGGDSLIRSSAAPSLVQPGPLRYALAPEGSLSPALRLAIWMCALGPPENRPEGAGPQESWPGCRRPPVPVAQVREAARDAAERVVAMACAARLEAHENAASPRPVDFADAQLQCRDLGLVYASNAGWAPPPHAACGRGADAAACRAASLLNAYARARRDGHFEGAMAGANCLRAVRVPADLRRPDAEPIPMPPAMRRAAVRACTSRAERLEDDAAGPTMTVLWAAGARDGASADKPSDAPAAPYVWAPGPDGTVEDQCAPFRLSDGFWTRFGESAGRGLGHAVFGQNPDLCPYHRMLSPTWLDSVQDETFNFVNDSTPARVVMIGASVAGARDLLEMRGVHAPGLWSHAMALDNLLAMGSEYRPGAYGAGFENGFGGAIAGTALEVGATLLTGFFLVQVWRFPALRRGRDACVRVVSTRLPSEFVEHASALLIDSLFAALPLWLLAAAFALMLPVPLIDWLGAAAIVSVAMRVTAPGRGGTPRQG